ncbi:MAG: ribonuclease HII [Rickettsiales bacterium]
MPHFELETHHAPHPVAGVDEAGRGPWAGPVVAAAVIFDTAHIPPGLDDSKKIRPARREELFAAIHNTARAVGVGTASVEEIDRLNIWQATALAMERAVAALPLPPTYLLIDGNRLPTRLPCPATAVIGGDGISLSIAAASIIAKTTRDRLMVELAQQFPHYGFERHAGYGTAAHASALAAHGPCPAHRTSFAPIRALLKRAA